MKKTLTLFIVCCSLVSFAQTKADDVKSFTLKNGMKFLVLEDSSIPNANMYLFYKVGSRNEHPGITGLSHFFEHMMFNGAKKYGPKMFDRTMEFNGGSNNAYTTENVTVYTDWFPASSMETIFELEADRIASLSIDPKMVASERGVVASEKSTGLENSQWELLSEHVSAAAFVVHPYHWPVIGYQDDIDNWTKEDLENYFHTYYAPNNCVVVMSGNIRLDDVKRLAEKYLEPIPAVTPPRPVHLVEPPQMGERRVMVQKQVNTPYIMAAYHTPNSRDKDYYALDILNYVLSSGNSSRLYSALVDKKQLATSISSDFSPSFDPGLFAFYGICAKGVKEADLENAIYEEIEKVKKDGITAQELQKIKNQKLMEFYSQIATINGKSNNIGTYELFFGDYRKMFDAPSEYEKVTLADVQRVANQYLKKSNRTVGILKANVEE
ncbi:M16 family metallopeptidase [Hufsiella ginkgonis]|uniref:Insulinase family protein n=1 Tax=Hufsiella ginkgonis TaxID=2695274 RepID=A0A7K1Y215_9SPHI|nr:pitrilysin family protein [Hufsiella ginkgonis]MXV17059.1 insulinase family protein [Hufsiella ginkgonis]